VPDVKRWYALAALIVILDQLSKWVVLENIQFGQTIYVAPGFQVSTQFQNGAT